MIDMTLKQAFEYFIMDRETFCQEETITNYKNTIRYFVQFIEQERNCQADSVHLSELTRFDLKNYVIYLRNKVANEGHTFKKIDPEARLSKRTVRNYSVDLKTFFNFLIQEEFCDSDILKNFKLIRSESKTVIPLTASEVAKIDKSFLRRYPCTNTSGIRNLCIIHLMLDAGLRSNEVCELRVDHVLLDNHQIFVKYGKGAKERVVPMGQDLRKYMWEWLNLYRKGIDHNYFLCAQDGSPLTECCIKSLFARLRKTSQIPRLKPHLLRHTFATCYIVDGGSVELLRILMGHSSISTTQIYMHIASVYDFQNDVYHLDPIFFHGYCRTK